MSSSYSCSRGLWTSALCARVLGSNSPRVSAGEGWWCLPQHRHGPPCLKAESWTEAPHGCSQLACTHSRAVAALTHSWPPCCLSAFVVRSMVTLVESVVTVFPLYSLGCSFHPERTLWCPWEFLFWLTHLVTSYLCISETLIYCTQFSYYIFLQKIHFCALRLYLHINITLCTLTWYTF